MRILLVNKFHWNKGGSEKYYFELGELLKQNGHEVAYFSMNDDNNINTGEKEYFVKRSDMDSKNITKALKIISSKENEKTMELALEDFKPDIVHLNNFQRQLSASIVKPIKKRNIPIVFTAHDVQAICPAITMMDSDKKPCELCMNGKYMNCFRKKCIKGSKLKSLLGAVEGKYYRVHKIYTNKIDYIVTPSEFYRKKFIEDGMEQNKVKTLYNFIDVKKYDFKNIDGGYALYFGRLSREKGIINLINAFSKMKEGVLYIAGVGPEEEEIIKIINQKKLQDRVKLLGFLNEKQMINVIKKCKFVVVPSIWYENCPYSILETMAVGKPIIGSDMGGIPELVIDKKNGLIYKYNDINDLCDKMKQLFNNQDLVDQYGKESKRLAEKKYSRDKYYQDIMKIYTALVEKVK